MKSSANRQKKQILWLDIENFFDLINHNKLMLTFSLVQIIDQAVSSALKVRLQNEQNGQKY